MLVCVNKTHSILRNRNPCKQVTFSDVLEVSKRVSVFFMIEKQRQSFVKSVN